MNHIDAKGKACPMPVMMAKKEMDTGCEALSITVDNAIAVQNLSRLAESQGFAAETAEKNGCYTITSSNGQFFDFVAYWMLKNNAAGKDKSV